MLVKCLYTSHYDSHLSVPRAVVFRLLRKSIAFPSSHKIVSLWYSVALSLQLANILIVFYKYIIITRSLLECLFSWRYNPLWFYFHSPLAGFSLLVFEVS